MTPLDRILDRLDACCPNWEDAIAAALFCVFVMVMILVGAGLTR